MQASIVDLRYNMKEVLRAIDRGEVVTILYRGKKKARIVPLASAPEPGAASAPRVEEQPAFGIWSDRADLVDPAAHVRNLRQPRALPQLSADKPKRKTRKLR